MLVKLTNGNKLSDEETKKITAGSLTCVIFLAMSDWMACGDPIDTGLMRDMIDSESIEH